MRTTIVFNKAHSAVIQRFGGDFIAAEKPK